MKSIEPFSDEQLRLLVNLEQQYEVWIEAERALAVLPYGMKWKRVSNGEYLYETRDRDGNGRSLGPKSAETEARYEAFRASKAALAERRDVSARRLAETCRMYRALRLPMIPTEAARVLREADRRGLLGSHLLVIGTNAMPAYAIEAGGRILGALDETQDFDLTWVAEESTEETPFWSMLKAVDPTYTVNVERNFQARNADAYEVELLVAPSRASTLGRREKPRPVPLPEQEFLLNGRPVSHVVVARDGSPARLVVPDPRWFALQKLWLSRQDKRSPLKRGKDGRQGMALLDVVREVMPHFPLDESFQARLPDELRPCFATWAVGPGARNSTPAW